MLRMIKTMYLINIIIKFGAAAGECSKKYMDKKLEKKRRRMFGVVIPKITKSPF